VALPALTEVALAEVEAEVGPEPGQGFQQTRVTFEEFRDMPRASAHPGPRLRRTAYLVQPTRRARPARWRVRCAEGYQGPRCALVK
jgi:hypothetical protein